MAVGLILKKGVIPHIKFCLISFVSKPPPYPFSVCVLFLHAHLSLTITIVFLGRSGFDDRHDQPAGTGDAVYV